MSDADRDLPTVAAASLPPRPPDTGPVPGVLLAAGTSDRFGERNKLLADCEGEPIVDRSARTLVEAGLDPVVAVLGHEAERVREALGDLSVRTVVADRYRRGRGASVRAGIEAIRELEPAADAAVVALGDMPFVDPGTIDALVDAHAAGVGDALAPAHDGVRGNPVLFDRIHFDALAALEGDVGGRSILLDGERSALVAVDDPGVRRDVDRPGDL